MGKQWTLDAYRSLIAENTIEISSPELDDNCPIVTVCITTFNHRKFIEQTLHGILGQETAFPIEVVIGDDCSTDGSLELLKRFHRENPQTLRLLLAKRNLCEIVGMPRCTLLKTLWAARGRYIALCEGDDYWTDPLKLQKQVDILEQNPSCALSFCNLQVLYDDLAHEPHDAYQEAACQPSESRIGVFAHPRKRTTLADLMKGNYIHTPGVLFRNWVSDEGIPEYMAEVRIGDWPLHLSTATRGDLHYSLEVMGVYRVHQGGMWSRRSESEKLLLSLGQYPPLLRSEIFDKGCEVFWLRKVRKQLIRGLKLATTHQERWAFISHVGLPIGGWYAGRLFRRLFLRTRNDLSSAHE